MRHEDYNIMENGFVGHLTGLMPNREREGRLYRMIPLVGLLYRSFGRYRRENMAYFEQSERAMIEWVNDL